MPSSLTAASVGKVGEGTGPGSECRAGMAGAVRQPEKQRGAGWRRMHSEQLQIT